MDKQSKKCRVCGDIASNFHYNGLCCYSCRMFFRRHALNQEKFKCEYTEKCEIDKISRKYCQRCRMDKCFQIGMQKELLESKCEIVQRKAKSDLQVDGEATTDTHSQLSLVKLPQSVSRNHLELNTTELKYIDELRRTTKSIFNFDEHKLPVVYEETNPIKAFKLGSGYTEAIAKYCKANSTYCSFVHSDQLAVVKQFMIHFMFIRIAFAYDCKKNACLTIADKSANSVVLTKFKVLEGFNSKQNQTNCLALSEEIEQDAIVYDLLTAQALYRSSDNTSSLEIMRYHYWSYHRLLLYYLQCKYGNLEKAQQKYSILIKLVNDLPNGFEYCRQFVARHQNDLADDLILEIFDIQPASNEQ